MKGHRDSQHLQDRVSERRELQRSPDSWRGPRLIVTRVLTAECGTVGKQHLKVFEGTVLSTHTGAYFHPPVWNICNSRGNGKISPWYQETVRARLNTIPDLPNKLHGPNPQRSHHLQVTWLHPTVKLENVRIHIQAGKRYRVGHPVEDCKACKDDSSWGRASRIYKELSKLKSKKISNPA